MPAKDFAHYRIERLLGRGGMGEVHLAQDTRLGRRVAIKFLSEQLGADEGAQRRFEIEARAVAALSHANIATIHDLGELDGRPYLVFEYVDGDSLAQRIDQGPLDVDETLRIAAALADALAHAHAHGVVHRDIKSRNVMLGQAGEVKLLDFGLALVEELTRVTLAQSTVGTAAYMSPEQLRGETVDRRSDIWSLGVLIQEMLTGTTPFSRATASATFEAIEGQEPPPLSSQRSGVPLELERIVGKCLAKQPGRRYQHAEELAVDLRAVGEQATRPHPLRARPRRRRWVGGLGAVAVLGALAFALLRLESSPAIPFYERDWVVLASFENLTGDTDFDLSLDAAFEVSLLQSQYVNVLPRGRVREALARMQREDLESLDARTAVELATRESIPIVVQPTISSVGNTHSLSAQLIDPQSGAALRSVAARARGKDEVLHAVEQLADELRRKLGESLAEIDQRSEALPQVTTSSLAALKDFAHGQRAFGARRYSEAYQFFRSAVDQDSLFALAHARLGACSYWNGNSIAGEAAFARALALQERLTARERLYLGPLVEGWRGNRDAAVNGWRAYLSAYPDDADGWHSVGYQLSQARRCAEAEEAFARLHELLPEDAAAYINMATCRTMLSQYEPAVAHFQKAFELRPDWLVSGNLNHEYGSCLIGAGRVDEARALFDRMLELEPETRARGLRSHAILLMWEGRYLEAIELLEECVRINQNIEHHLSALRNHGYLARIQLRLGKTAAWKRSCDAAMAELRREFAGLSWGENVAVNYLRGGDRTHVPELLERMEAHASATRHLDAVHLDRVRAEFALVEGDAETAIELLERAHAIGQRVDDQAVLGRAYLAAGRTLDARNTFRAVLAQQFLGWEGQEDAIDVMLALIELEEPPEARNLAQALGRQWSRADPELLALPAVRAALARGEAADGR